MIDNVHEISSHPAFGLSTRFDTLAQYDPSREQDFRNVADNAYDIAEGLRRQSVEYDSALRIVHTEFEDRNISVADCWKLTEASQGGAPLLDIKTGSIIKTYSYFIGFVLTRNGEILEYEKAGYSEDDMGLIHVVDRHRGIYVKRGLLSKRCYVDENILNRLDDLSYKAGLRNNS